MLVCQKGLQETDTGLRIAFCAFVSCSSCMGTVLCLTAAVLSGLHAKYEEHLHNTGSGYSLTFCIVISCSCSLVIVLSLTTAVLSCLVSVSKGHMFRYTSQLLRLQMVRQTAHTALEDCSVCCYCLLSCFTLYN